jgi:hypothetical protein
MIMEGIQGPPVAEHEQLTFSQRCWAVDAVMLAYSCIRWNGSKKLRKQKQLMTIIKISMASLSSRSLDWLKSLIVGL